jgi:hypothetical protein
VFDQSDKSWYEKSARQTDGAVDCYFLCQTTLFVGDDRNYERDQHERVELPVPAGPVRDGFCRVRASEVSDVQSLVEHYLAVLEVARKHKKSFNSIRQHFWLRLSVEWPEEEALWFPWFDTWDHMDAGLSKLRAGQEWWDADQGWESILIKDGEWVHVRVGDGEGSEFFNVALPADRLFDSAERLRSRMSDLIGQLTAQIGADLWTSYRDRDDLPRPK